ncbi:MAG: hypothetical protein R6U27_08995 [Desulfobacterales bacterium]
MFLFIFFIGCSSVSNVKDATVNAAKTTVDYTTKLIPYMAGPDDGMVRKVAVIPFENETVFKQLSLEKVFQNTIVQYFSESCSGIHLLFPETPGFPEPLKGIQSQSSAAYDNLMLVQTGRQSGLNAVLTGKIVNLSLSKKDEGILWFRETKEQLRIQCYLKIIDMETGAKIFDDQFVHEIDNIEPEEIQAFKDGQPAIFASIAKDIEKLAKNMAQKMCTAVLAQPWTGYIASVVNERAFLPFGKSSGIKESTILDSYDTGEVVQNNAGEQFLLPGKKNGKIKVSQVEEDFSVGEIISGENIRAGNPVKLSK